VDYPSTYAFNRQHSFVMWMRRVQISARKPAVEFISPCRQLSK